MKRNMFTVQLDGKKLGEINATRRALKMVFADQTERKFESLGEIAEFIDNLRDAGHYVVIKEG